MAAAVRTFVQPIEIPAGFDVTPTGIYFTDSDPSKQLTTVPAWVAGVHRTLIGNHWSVEVAWKDHDGNIKTAIIAYTDLLQRSNILEELAQDGLLFLPGATNLFARYVALAVALPTTPRVRTHRKLGFFTLERDGQPDTLGFMLPYTCLLPARDVRPMRRTMTLRRKLTVPARQTSVVAEGVETTEQRDFLLQLGARYAQGYYFARPLAPPEFERFVRRAHGWVRRGLWAKFAYRERSGRNVVGDLSWRWPE